MQEQRNLIIALVLSVGILFLWQVLVVGPEQAARRQALEQTEQTTPTGDDNAIDLGLAPALPLSGPQESALNRAAERGKPTRITVSSPRVEGSINLRGGRIDDWVLRQYRAHLDPESLPVAMLYPTDAARPYYVDVGLSSQNVITPDGNTLWEASGNSLQPGQPVTLRWNNGAGMTFERIFTLDNDYMVEIQQRVINDSGEPVVMAPYALVSRTGKPKTVDFYILHEGLIGYLDGGLHEEDYSDIIDDRQQTYQTTGGWLGITDKYWLAAIIPEPDQAVTARFSAGTRGAEPLFQTDYVGAVRTIQPGDEALWRTRAFIGAKETTLLDQYSEALNIAKFDLAVDFGWLYFLTKPIFLAIKWLYGFLGNFGLAILALTVGIKLVFFPLANKAYTSMARMKLLHPKVLEIKERTAGDKMQFQKEIMALYKQEKVNPLSGCLPILLQLPVFFALYKVLFVAIEMRHAPFYGWIHDLSAPDPLGMLTLFGLIPWDVPAYLAIVNIGIWPVLMGVSMWVQQKLNPTPSDPIQAKVFAYMPLIFTFFLATFPAGLVIYWTWNNVLSMAQQWLIMRRIARQQGNA